MSRRQSAFTFLCLLLLLLFGCASRTEEGGAQSTSSAQTSASGAEESSQPEEEGLAVNDPENFLVCLYRQGYDENWQLTDYYVPLRRTLPQERLTAGLLTQLLGGADPYGALKLSGLTLEGDTARAEIAQIEDGYEDAAYPQLCSLYLTLTENVKDIKKLQIIKEGGFRFDPGLEEGGFFEPRAPILPPSHTREEIDSVRSRVPYQAPDLFTPIQELPDPIGYDEKTGRLAAFLLNITLFNFPEEGFASPEDIPNGFLLHAALNNTPLLVWDDSPADDGISAPSLSIATLTAQDTMGHSKEHVEQTAQLIFGGEVSLTHTGQGISPWHYDEYSGLYTPPHMGMPGSAIPVILDTRESEAGYELTVAFPQNVMGDYQDSEGNPLAPGEVEGYCRAQLPHCRVVLTKDGDALHLSSLKWEDAAP